MQSLYDHSMKVTRVTEGLVEVNSLSWFSSSQEAEVLEKLRIISVNLGLMMERQLEIVRVCRPFTIDGQRWLNMYQPLTADSRDLQSTKQT